MATREAVGLYDVYYQGPIDIKGPDAQALLDHVLARDVPRRLATDGQVLYSSVCNDAGGMVDDLTAYRLGPEHYWLIATPARAEAVERHVTEQARDRRAYVTNCISGTAYLSVQGPGSRALLQPLTDAGSRDRRISRTSGSYRRRWPTCRRCSLAPATRESSATSSTTRETTRSTCGTRSTAAGATPCGLGALRSTRMEKKYPLYGLDVSETTSPLEAGSGWAVDLDAGAVHRPRRDLRRQRDQGIETPLTGIELPDLSHVPVAGDAVSGEDGRELGALTSTRSRLVPRKALAMGYLPATLPVGTSVTLTSPDGAAVGGVTTHRPFYDPDGTRVPS